MSESHVTSIFSPAFDPENPAHVWADVAPYLRPDLPPTRRSIVYPSRQGERTVDVRITWEAQCLVARREDLSTPTIIQTHSVDFDRQIALLIASKPAPADGAWILDASDIVPII